MGIDKITSQQFESDIETGIKSRTVTHDTAYGPVREVVITPMGRVLERQNDRIRQVSLLVSLVNSTEFTDADLDALVYNEGLTRITGSRATGTVTFSRTTAPTIDTLVQRGFPIASQPDEGTGSTITFVTTEARTMYAATAASYFNLVTQRYELQVPVTAVVEGSSGVVGIGRINRALRPLSGFDSVSNPAATQGGRDTETNAELIERYLIAIIGRELATPDGVTKYAQDNFLNVEDVLTVYGSNALMTRAASEAGAVDAYVLGTELTTQTDNLTYVGAGQLLAINAPPLVRIDSVVRVASATAYTESVDYTVVYDAGGNAGSRRAADGIKFNVGVALLVPGDIVAVTYTYDNLIRSLQAGFEQDNTLVHGRDLLFKRAAQVDVILEAQLHVTTGFNTTAVTTLVQTAVLEYINALQLGDDVEISDIQGVVRRISGVDNFIITRLVSDVAASGSVDLLINENEYASIATADLVLTLI